MEFLTQPTRTLFFTGKGGVGKTSLACASAVHLADAGKKVLPGDRTAPVELPPCLKLDPGRLESIGTAMR